MPSLRTGKFLALFFGVKVLTAHFLVVVEAILMYGCGFKRSLLFVPRYFSVDSDRPAFFAITSSSGIS